MLAAILMPIFRKKVFYEIKSRTVGRDEQGYSDRNGSYCYYKQQDKMLQREIKRLTRNERTHRLCTRGGMIESFIQEPEKLSDDQVMELLTVAFRQPEVSGLLQKMLEEAKAKPLFEG